MNAVSTVTCPDCGVFTVSIDGPDSLVRCMDAIREHREERHDRLIHEDAHA